MGSAGGSSASVTGGDARREGARARTCFLIRLMMLEIADAMASYKACASLLAS